MEAPFAGWSRRSNRGPSQLGLLGAQSVMQASGTSAEEGGTDLVGLVNVIAGQRAQKVLQAWDVVVIDGMDDGFHHKGVFLVLRDMRRERVACWPGSSSTQQVNPGLFAIGAF